MELFNLTTGERVPGHRLGTTEDGRPVYQRVEGYEPCVPCEADEEGDWVPIPDATVARVVGKARESAAVYFWEFQGETLDPARSDWDAEAWAIDCGELRRDGVELSTSEQDTLWPVYQDALAREINRLAASLEGV